MRFKEMMRPHYWLILVNNKHFCGRRLIFCFAQNLKHFWIFSKSLVTEAVYNKISSSHGTMFIRTSLESMLAKSDFKYATTFVVLIKTRVIESLLSGDTKDCHFGITSSMAAASNNVKSRTWRPFLHQTIRGTYAPIFGSESSNRQCTCSESGGQL